MDEGFEFEVAGWQRVERYGVLVFGWFRSGSIRPGAIVHLARLPGRPVKVVAAGNQCGPGPSAGGPDGQLAFDDEALAREVVPGDIVTA